MATMRKTVITAALLAALGGSLTACNGAGDTPRAPKQPNGTVSASKEAGTDDKGGDDSGSDETSDDTTLTVALDGTAKWRNGVKATLSGFSRGFSSDTAMPEHTAYLGFTVTIVNGWNKPIDLSMTQLSCPNGGDEIFDSEKGLNGLPDSHVLPGKSGTWKTACAFKKSDNKVQIEIEPYDADSLAGYRTAIFTGEVK
ncbi:hypothetical protein [Streptomyces sp. NBC_01579]|uniref:hypothetical protein n=1 Tax=Streptomyces sp. NBC_01579 TaxID=2975885 RepID=UPI00386F0D9D